MRDPYDVLGVPRSAEAAAIKSAYRRLAKKLHPDANKNDPTAAQRFGELNTAYEILSDGSKRKAFDRGEIDAEGKPRFQGFEGFRQQPGARGSGRRRPPAGRRPRGRIWRLRGRSQGHVRRSSGPAHQLRVRAG